MELFDRIIGILGPIILIVGVGFFFAKKSQPDLSVVNKLNLNLFTPFLIFSVLSQKNIELDQYLLFAFVAVLVVLLPGLLSIPLTKRLGVSWRTFLPPMMFRNSGNLGLPTLLLAFGEQAIAAAVILFLIENTLHFSLGMRMLRTESSLLSLLKIPILQATLVGVVVAHLDFSVPQPVAIGVEMLGQISIPLMLLSLGARMAQTQLSDIRLGLVSAIWAPLSGLLSLALVLAMVLPFTGLSKDLIAMLVIFAALPPAVLNFLIAEQLNQEPDRVASIVLLGNLSALITLPIVFTFVL
ncbi:AEC family transporter [Oleiphilus sp. HI0125]|uniref:AEC family transporter n=1 Tax=Oleiphilus sp. HI0125 TaxID=1822266 RepID=UPI00083829BF|nr:AEC family transporter [Oleiphilus sp. HI0125]